MSADRRGSLLGDAVAFHLRQIYRKLDIASRVQLTRLVLEHWSEQADAGAFSGPESH